MAGSRAHTSLSTLRAAPRAWSFASGRRTIGGLLGLVGTLALAACHAGDLLTAPPESADPPTPPEEPDAEGLEVVPATLSQTLVSGLGDVLAIDLEVTPPDSGSVQWSLEVEDGGPWLRPVAIGGDAPGVLTITLDPEGHEAARYEATLVVEGVSATLAPTRVPVVLDLVDSSSAPRVAECVILSLPQGAALSGTVREDCRATAWDHLHYARTFRFQGRAGEAVSISASSPDFGPIFPLFGPGDWPGGPILRLVNTCPENAGGTRSCLLDYVLPEDGPYTIEVTPWQHGFTGRFTVRVEQGAR